MTSDSFTVKDLGVSIARALGLKEGDTVELQRNRLDRNELKIIKHPKEIVSEVAASPAKPANPPTRQDRKVSA